MQDQDATQLLISAQDGNSAAASDLLPLVYDELRQRAASYLQQERADHTLQPTALVHEAFIKLLDQTRVNWQNRGHFTALAAVAMRRILVDHARTRSRSKRGGDRQRIDFDDQHIPADDSRFDLVGLDEALKKLEALDPQQVKVVEMKYFGGFSMDEIAAALDVSVRTVHREWTMAKAFLRGELNKGEDAHDA